MATSFDYLLTSRAAVNSSHKRRKKSDDHHHCLLPGLPNHIAQICLFQIPPSTLFSVCRSWRRVIYSPTFPPFLSLYMLSTTTAAASTIHLSSFDPISCKWISITPSLPPPLDRLCLRHPSFISWNLPIQSISVAGKLVLLAATTSDLLPALSGPLIFNPQLNSWSHGPPLSAPRRWCAAGASRGTAVVASGIGSHYAQDIARSVEKWVLRKIESCDKKRKDSDGFWEKMRSLRDSKLCREAIDAVGWRGKLCMVNVKGDSWKEGFVYDLDSDEWAEMTPGMLGGWRGPAAAMDEETIYVVDESRGVLRSYDDVADDWTEVFEDERLRGAECIAAGGGKVCVVCGGGVGILVVDMVVQPPRWWVLETPPENQVLALHILPRMSLPEFQSPVLASESI